MPAFRGKSVPEMIAVAPNNPLLKIESVISHHRQTKLMKSHSITSSAYLKKINTEKRSTANEGGGSENQRTTDSMNGIYRIKRAKKEKEKFPDRINLDKKGLTTIPYIEDESSLRLLSLQHNLINVFHVPNTTASEAKQQKEEITQKDSEVVTAKQVNRQENENSNSNPSSPSEVNPVILGKLSSRMVKQQLYNYGARRYPKNGSIYYNSGLIITSSTSTLAPSLLNSIPSYTSNHHKSSLQLLNVNQKLILKKSSVLAASKLNQKLVESHINREHVVVEAQVPKQQHDFVPFVRLSESLQNLVFLDLYNNQIETIGALDGLKNLTVLLLGKNRIVDISGIVSLRRTLRVLDLHGNKIVNISQKISSLQELKSLNLAGNLLKQIYGGDFSGLFNLKELNLKRNKIKKISGFEDLRNLERLWICHNELHKVEDMSAIAKAINLKEITIENNPVSLAGDCCSFLVSYLPNLVLLSQMHVTDQVKRAAMAWRKSKENSDVNFASLSSGVGQNIRREEVISNARTNWELLRSQQQGLSKLKREPPVSKPTPRDTDLESSISENNLTSKKIVPKLNQSKKLQRSTSQEMPTPKLPTSIAPNPEQQEFFRLPPILAPLFLDQAPKSSHSSAESSSLGPNLDSSASSFSSRSSSDSEDAPGKSSAKVDRGVIEEPRRNVEKLPNNQMELKKESLPGEIKFTTPIIVETPPEEKVEQRQEEQIKRPTVKYYPENDSQFDNKSNLSVASSSRTTDSTASNSAEDQPTTRTPKTRSATGKKLLTPGPVLLRAQTAKNGPTPSSSSTGINTGSSAKVNLTPQVVDREREQGGDYLIEICGRYLNVYGVQALKFIDKQWNMQKSMDVHTIKFSYINFNNICQVFSKIKTRFQNAENFVFRETNIMCLGQLNSLAEIQGINSLVIEPEGNLICTKSWRSYAIFRLSHWGLKQINGTSIAEDEIKEADAQYSRLVDLVLWSLPEHLVSPLLSRLRLEETTACQVGKRSAKEWLMQADDSLKMVVGKEALQWRKGGIAGITNCNNNNNINTTQDEQAIRSKGKLYFSAMMENTCNAVEKLDKLQSLWPQMLLELMRNNLIEFSQLCYVKNLMAELFK